MMSKILLVVTMLGLCCVLGCAMFESSSTFAPPNPPPAVVGEDTLVVVDEHGLLADYRNSPESARQGLMETFASLPEANVAAALAELSYREARRAERRDCPSCVDLYYQAACYAYYVIAEPSVGKPSKACQAAPNYYNASLERLIATGQFYKRLDPTNSLRIQLGEDTINVPMVSIGLPWRMDEVNQLLPVGYYEADSLSTSFQQSGEGLPIVGVRHRKENGRDRFERFYAEQHAFPATAILRPSWDAATPGSRAKTGERKTAAQFPFAAASLELYNPKIIEEVTIRGKKRPLRGDLTAPWAFFMEQEDQETEAITAFVNPLTLQGHEGIYMVEPYEHGKIPIVFTHGLLSGALTWAEMINTLQADPEIRTRYQFWLYMYPTGVPFLRTAAKLRTDLEETVLTVDPLREDEALRHQVLIGHSMGGLINKLQAVDSTERLWYTVAKLPIETLETDEQTRLRLQQAFYFAASSDVERLIHIATPHQGSTFSQRLVGRIASGLVRPPLKDDGPLQELLRNNKDIIRPEFQRVPNSSIDLLSPESEILQSIYRLHYAPWVNVHSIVGTGGLDTPLHKPSDSVVTVDSATDPASKTVKKVDEFHTRVHRHPHTIAEVKRILKQHPEKKSP